ncbi:MAG: UDP-N-acetylmuramoyl-tripeptide--D-alanyl-D-alanine ligase [Phycisphaerae bacterium]|nr:MAG: UDP-N-acetylmuramoyl-tripeptide--D-alanyl-D-alanine ligase [Phycisphaerae bacterium]
MIPMSIAQIAWAANATPSSTIEDGMVTGISTDSRAVKPGELFVAIKGDRFDGHDYVEQAVSQGAKACLVTSGFRSPTGAPLLYADDVVEALGKIAAHHRRIGSAKVIGITGSAGKTTTKAMIAHVLGDCFPIAYAPRSFNNQIGVPLTLLSANHDDRFVIVEIGTSRPGEVGLLSAMAKPDVGVVTSVGAAHLAGFGSIDAVRREKLSLFDHVAKGGRAYVNARAVDGIGVLPRSAEIGWQTFGEHQESDLLVTEIAGDLKRTTARINGRFELELSVAGPHNAVNACAAFGVCLACGVAPEQVLSSLKSFSMPPMRLNVSTSDRWTIIDDCYNANPLSVAASLDVLKSDTKHRRVFVAGTMAELGEAAADLHHEMGMNASASGVDVLIAVGEFAGHVAKGAKGHRGGMRIHEFESVDDACSKVPSLLQDGDTILVKGSRSAGLERIVGELSASQTPTVARAT